jgi:small-conductance mechanosensitive channel/CRP-like cAMP-binding protein
MDMAQLIAGNLLVTLSLAFVAPLLLVRVLVKQPQLRKDAGGAAKYLLASVVVHGLGWGLEHLLFVSRATLYVHVLEPLLFGFGCIRALVGLTIWVFRSRRNIPTPKIVRDVVDGGLYAVCLAFVVRATTTIDLASIVATSAALSVIIGLALQESLGNLFAGLSLQLEHPFQVGDWISVNEFIGRVVQVAWRGTRLETLRREQVTVPNSSIAKANVVNFSRHRIVARDLTLGVAYRCAPNHVKAVLQEVLANVPEVLKTPPPSVHVKSFDDHQITYLLRYHVQGFEHAEGACDAVLGMIWYRFKRDDLEIPFPVRTVQLERASPGRNTIVGQEQIADTLSLLATVDFLKPLGDDGRMELAKSVRRELFGAGETIIRAGEAGDTFHMVASGEVGVRAVVGAKEQEVASLQRGGFFGEMSLLTGEPRTATVSAKTDAIVVSMSRAAFAGALAHHASVAHELADILGRRRAELALARASGDQTTDAKAESKRIFSRLRELFKVAE